MNTTTTDPTIQPSPASHATCNGNGNGTVNHETLKTGHTRWQPPPICWDEEEKELAAALRWQLDTTKSMDSAAPIPTAIDQEIQESSDIDLERTKAPETQLVLAPTAQHEITRDMLTPGPKLDAFAMMIIRCAAFNPDFATLAAQVINIDARTGKSKRNDFLNSIDSLMYAGMEEFLVSASPGTPRPASASEWREAIHLHLEAFFKRNPEYPAPLAGAAEAQMQALQPPHIGDLDRVCDGLLDYIRGVRLSKVEAETAKADPATKLTTILAVESPIRVPGSKKRWQGLTDLGEFEVTPYLVDDLLIEGTVSMLYGPPADGKTFFALDLGASIASGRTWNGLHTERGGVLYYCLEGGTGFRNRMRAMKHKGLLRDEDPFEFSTEALDLRSPDAHTRILNDIKASEDRFKMKVKLIVIDTLAVATSGGNECTSEDMGSALHQVSEVVKASGVTALLLHHPGKDVSRGPRGWSGIGGNLDTIIETDKVSKELRRATVKKQKDGEEGQVFSFGLEIVNLGSNPRGKPVTSCIVRHLTVEEAGKAAGDDPEGMLCLIWKGRPVWDPIGTAIVCTVLRIEGRSSVRSTRATDIMQKLENAGLVSNLDQRGPSNSRQWQLTPNGREVVQRNTGCSGNAVNDV